MSTTENIGGAGSASAIMASVAASVAALLPTDGFAQTAAGSANSTELATVNVEDNADASNTLTADTGLARLPGPIQDIPRTITVISPELIQQQNITTLEQALRNVPGVTVAIGEGGGGMNGDQFRIRGFQAKGDIYVDGLRDFGVYVRDSFAYESVQVIMGPASESFGMGTTGGAINSTLKAAHLGDKYTFDGSLGTGPLYRGIVDLNKQINDTTAVRVVGMWNDQDVADRDHVEANRAGLYGAVAFGLGTDQTLNLNYLYQHGDRTPDYGVPVISPAAAFRSTVAPPIASGVTPLPTAEFGVPSNYYYGKETDHDKSDVNMFTARYKKEVNDWLTITNDTRLAYYNRDFATSVPECGYDNGTGTLYATTCSGRTFAGLNPTINFGGGQPGYLQESYGGQNLTTAVAKFNTGTWRHELITGVDYFYQNDERTGLGVWQNGVLLTGAAAIAAKTPGTILMPNYYNTTGYYIAPNGLALKDAWSSDLGLFISDRLWFTDQLSILGGVRWDRFESHYKATDTTTGSWLDGASINTSSTTEAASPKASVIWEPTKTQTYYVTWAQSFTPQGAFVTNDATVISATQRDMEPEENTLWEAGAKVSFLDGKLGVTAALYQVEKSNQAYTDPTSGDTLVTGDKVRVRGVEFGVTGNITEAWTVQAAYAYMDGTIVSTPATAILPANYYAGNQAPYVPKNAASLWTTYELTKGVVKMPGKLLVGGGFSATDGYYTNNNNVAWIPGNFSLDALVSYEYDKYRVALNTYNLTDELNYSAGFGNRAIPASGRTFTLSAGVTF